MSKIDYNKLKDTQIKRFGDSSAWYVKMSAKQAVLYCVLMSVMIAADISFLVGELILGYDTVGLALTAAALAVEICFFALGAATRFAPHERALNISSACVFALGVVPAVYYGIAVAALMFIVAALRILPVGIYAAVSASSLKEYSGKDFADKVTARMPALKIAALCIASLCFAVAALSQVFFNFNDGTFFTDGATRRMVYSYNAETGEATLVKILGGSADFVLGESTIHGGRRYDVTGIAAGAFSMLGEADEPVLPTTIKTLDGGVFEGSDIKRVIVRSTQITLAADLAETSVNEIYIENGDCEITFDGKFDVTTGLKISVPESAVNSIRASHPEHGFLFAPQIDDGKLYVNFNDIFTENNTLPDTLIAEKDGNGSITVTEFLRESDEIRVGANGRSEHFVWWYYNDAHEQKTVSLPFTVSQSINLFAAWRPIYNISLDDDGARSELTYYESGGDVTLPDAQKDGYEFIGWYEVGKGTSKAERDSFISTIDDSGSSDYSLYAKFLPKYSVTADCVLPSAEIESTVSYYHEWMDDITLASPECVGYRFVGWNDGGTIKSGSTGDKAFVADWELSAPTVQKQDYIGTYDGAEHNISVTATHEAGSLAYSYSWKRGDEEADGATNTFTVKQVADSDKYTCTVTAEDEFGYSSSAEAECEVTISKKSVSVTAANIEITYGDAPPEYTFGYGEFADGDSPETVVGTPTVSAEYARFGEAKDYVISVDVSALDADNYSFVAVNGKLTVAPKVIAVEWGDAAFVYNGAEQAPEARIAAGSLVRAEDTCTLTVGGKQKNANEDGKTYTATVIGLSNGNYALPNDSTITKAYTISRAPLTVTAKPHSVTYGSAPANGGVEYSGFVGTDGESALGGRLSFGYTYKLYDDIGDDYEISVSGLTSGNYDITYAVGKLTVTPKTVGISWGNASFTYTGKPQIPTATATGTVNNDACVLTVVGEQTVAGKYTAEVTGIGNGNYVLPQSTTKSFTIGKAKLTVTTKPYTITYGYAPSANDVEPVYEGFVNGEDVSVLKGEAKYTFSYAQFDNIGANNFTVTPSGLSADNYEIINVAGKLTVEKWEISIQWGNLSLVYNGAVQKPTATAVDLARETDVCALTVSVTSGGKDAGSYTAKVTGIGNANYKLPAQTETAFEITSKALTVKAKDVTVTYGADLPKFTAEYDGFVANESAATLGVNLAFGCGYSKYADVGEYKIIPGLFSSRNYDATYIDGTLTVVQKEIGISWAGLSVAYNGKPQAPTATATGTLNNDECNLTVTGGGTNVDKYDVEVTAVSNENYKLPANTKAQLNIYTAVLTITARPHTITYGDVPSNNGVTYTGFVNGETESDLGGTLIYTYSYEQYGNVGDYTITPGGFSSTNYNIRLVVGTLTVQKKEIQIAWSGISNFTYSGKPQAPTATAIGLARVSDTCTLTVSGAQTNANADDGYYTATVTALSNSNYELPQDRTQRFKINTATLNITAKDKTITYGDAPSNNGVTYDGFVNGETASALVGTLGYTYSYERYGKVGDYIITPAGQTSGNYKIVYYLGKLTVERKEVGLEWGNTLLEYSGVAQTPTVTATGLVNGDVCTVTVTGGQKDASLAEYTATASALSNDNYKLPQTVTKTFSVWRKTLTITAESHTITYGEAPSIGGVTYAGFVNGETASDLKGTLSLSCSYERLDDIGSYPITPSGLSGDNYYIVYKDGTLTVNAKPMSDVTIKLTSVLTYNGENQTQRYIVTADGIPYDNITYTVKRASDLAWKVGTYTLTLVGTGNFTGECSTQFIVKKRGIYFPQDTHTYIYNASEQTYRMTPTPMYSIKNNKHKDAGEYDVTVSLIDPDNDEWEDGSIGDLTYKFVILPRDISDARITFTNSEKLIYNGTELTAETYVLVEGMTATYDVKNNSDKATLAGSYTLTIVGTGNFSGECSAQYIVEKRIVGAPNRDDSTFIYNGEEQTYFIDPDPLYTVSGNKQTNAGEHIVTVTLTDTANTKWKVGVDTKIEYLFVIERAPMQKPSLADEYESIDALNLALSELSVDGLTVMVGNEVDGKVEVTFILSYNYKWSDGDTDGVYSVTVGIVPTEPETEE